MSWIDKTFAQRNNPLQQCRNDVRQHVLQQCREEFLKAHEDLTLGSRDYRVAHDAYVDVVTMLAERGMEDPQDFLNAVFLLSNESSAPFSKTLDESLRDYTIPASAISPEQRKQLGLFLDIQLTTSHVYNNIAKEAINHEHDEPTSHALFEQLCHAVAAIFGDNKALAEERAEDFCDALHHIDMMGIAHEIYHALSAKCIKNPRAPIHQLLNDARYGLPKKPLDDPRVVDFVTAVVKDGLQNNAPPAVSFWDMMRGEQRDTQPSSELELVRAHMLALLAPQALNKLEAAILQSLVNYDFLMERPTSSAGIS